MSLLGRPASCYQTSSIRFALEVAGWLLAGFPCVSVALSLRLLFACCWRLAGSWLFLEVTRRVLNFTVDGPLFPPLVLEVDTEGLWLCSYVDWCLKNCFCWNFPPAATCNHQSSKATDTHGRRTRSSTGWPRHRENREFGSYFFQTGKTQGILL